MELRLSAGEEDFMELSERTPSTTRRVLVVPLEHAVSSSCHNCRRTRPRTLRLRTFRARTRARSGVLVEVPVVCGSRSRRRRLHRRGVAWREELAWAGAGKTTSATSSGPSLSSHLPPARMGSRSSSVTAISTSPSSSVSTPAAAPPVLLLPAHSPQLAWLEAWTKVGSGSLVGFQLWAVEQR